MYKRQLIDSACIIWGEKCGEKTNCLVYNTDAMRHYITGFTCAAMVLSFLCDVGVWYYMADLDLYGSEEDSTDSATGNNSKKGSIDKLTDDSGIGANDEEFTDIELNDLKKE